MFNEKQEPPAKLASSGGIRRCTIVSVNQPSEIHKPGRTKQPALRGPPPVQARMAARSHRLSGPRYPLSRP